MNFRPLVSLLGAAIVVSFAQEGFAQITDRHLDKLPTPYVDRPLTLPEMTLGAELDVSFNHAELAFGPFSEAYNGAFIDIGGRFGILDDIEVEAVVVSLATEEYAIWPIGAEAIDGADWGMTRLGATLRFFAEDSAEIGARFRFLIDNNATIGLNAGLPIRLRVPGVLRFDTGIAFIGMIQTQSEDAQFGLIDVNQNPSAPEPGIPLRLTFQAIEELFIGLNSGFGATDVSEDGSIFFPLGASLGGTVGIGNEMLLDLIGSFNFPLFGIPAANDLDASVGSELWQVGFAGKFYLPIK